MISGQGLRVQQGLGSKQGRGVKVGHDARLKQDAMVDLERTDGLESAATLGENVHVTVFFLLVDQVKGLQPEQQGDAHRGFGADSTTNADVLSSTFPHPTSQLPTHPALQLSKDVRSQQLVLSERFCSDVECEMPMGTHCGWTCHQR